jgi:hypothetical protein
MDFTILLQELFTPIATSSHLCIVLPPTNATHYDLKPHVIQLLLSFYGLDHENPYAYVKKFKNICATTKFRISLRNLSTLDFFFSPFMIEPQSGWIPMHLGLLALGRAC